MVNTLPVSIISDELARLRRRSLGLVFQDFNLVPTLTAIENISLPLELAGADVDPAWRDTLVSTLGLADRLGRGKDVPLTCRFIARITLAGLVRIAGTRA